SAYRRGGGTRRGGRDRPSVGSRGHRAERIVKLLQPSELPANPDRPATRLLHDEPNVRLVAFHLQPGQVVKEHFSPSSVLLQVIEGEGLFTGDGGDARLAAGEAVMYAPG